MATGLWSHPPWPSMELLRLGCVVTYLGRRLCLVALGVLPAPLRGAQRGSQRPECLVEMWGEVRAWVASRRLD